MAAILPSEVLAKAADLIEPEGAWMQGAWGLGPLDENGIVDPETANCFCLYGALYRIVQPDMVSYWGPVGDAGWAFLDRVVGGTPITWNDAPDRTQAEVVAALRKASELAKGEGQ